MKTIKTLDRVETNEKNPSQDLKGRKPGDEGYESVIWIKLAKGQTVNLPDETADRIVSLGLAEVAV